MQHARVRRVHMSVRQYSLNNLVPWTNGGVLSLLRVSAQLKTKESLLGVSATIQSHFSLGLRRHRFGGWGGVLSLLGLIAYFLYLTAFLLVVPDTRVLAIARMQIQHQALHTSTDMRTAYTVHAHTHIHPSAE